VGFKRINRPKYSWIKSINAPVSAVGNVSVPGLMSQVGRLREAVCVFVRLALKVVMQNDGDIVGCHPAIPLSDAGDWHQDSLH
jgi:hypothetical protein